MDHFNESWWIKLPDLSEFDLEKWNKYVRNANYQTEDQQQQNLQNLIEEKTLLLQLWIMDRLKEAMDQYVKGGWMSSIALCGAIAEFVTETLIRAYKIRITKMKFPKNFAGNLQKLLCNNILDIWDFELLDEIRKIRNKQIHPAELSKSRLEQGLEEYKIQLKSKNLKGLKDLFAFFDHENISTKCPEYLVYLSQFDNHI